MIFGISGTKQTVHNKEVSALYLLGVHKERFNCSLIFPLPTCPLICYNEIWHSGIQSLCMNFIFE